MKFLPIQSREKIFFLSKKEKKIQTAPHVIPIPFSSDVDKSTSSHFLSENVLRTQKKLAKLGLYNGPLDGLEGPKTRHAIALWKQKNILSNSANDEIALLIKRSEMEMENEKTQKKDLPYLNTTVLKLSVADIIRVQKALRIFGNQEVEATGIEDQKTVDALKQFQKTFHLPITGQIDNTILMKMHEIGLLN
ncbi:peptidoglycan-binding protein [Bartonella raoultii]|nr:peptidoglycan-binding protein [Bartonella raoultii]